MSSHSSASPGFNPTRAISRALQTEVMDNVGNDDSQNFASSQSVNDNEATGPQRRKPDEDEHDVDPFQKRVSSHLSNGLNPQPRVGGQDGVNQEEVEMLTCWIAAEHALSHIQKTAPQIESVFSSCGIPKSQYVILAGFDESTIEAGIGYLEQIHIFTSADFNIIANSPLIAQLGKLMSPFSSVLFTESSRPYHLPAFKPDGTLWGVGELTFRTASKFLDRGSTAAMFPTVICLSQTCSGAAPVSVSGNDEKSCGSGKEQKTGDRLEKQDKYLEGKEERKADKSDQDRKRDPKVNARGRPKSKTIRFDVSSDLHSNDHSEHFQSLTVDGAFTIQHKKNTGGNTECHIRFTKLNFGSIPPTTGTAAYEQSFLRITVDSREEVSFTDILKPWQTSSAEPSRINPQDIDSRATCGFTIDDPHHRKEGIKMPDTILPAIDIQFLDSPTYSKPFPAPSAIDVEIISYWSAMSLSEEGFPWLSGISSTPNSMEAVSPYSNLCQAVVLKIPFPPTKHADFEAKLRVKVKHVDVDLGFSGDARFEDSLRFPTLVARVSQEKKTSNPEE